MAITTAQCRSFKVELLQGIHDLSVDVVKCAIYDSNATLDSFTTAYSATNEVTSLNYAAGGQVVPLVAGYPQIDAASGQAWVRFQSIIWTPVTFAARGALFYNASKANRAICVVDFGAIRAPANGAFGINFPLVQPPLIILA